MTLNVSLYPEKGHFFTLTRTNSLIYKKVNHSESYQIQGKRQAK